MQEVLQMLITPQQAMRYRQSYHSSCNGFQSVHTKFECSARQSRSRLHLHSLSLFPTLRVAPVAPPCLSAPEQMFSTPLQSLAAAHHITPHSNIFIAVPQLLFVQRTSLHRSYSPPQEVSNHASPAETLQTKENKRS